MLRVAHQAFNSKLAATRYATNVARASDELVCTLPMYEWISADDTAILKYSQPEDSCLMQVKAHLRNEANFAHSRAAVSRRPLVKASKSSSLAVTHNTRTVVHADKHNIGAAASAIIGARSASDGQKGRDAPTLMWKKGASKASHREVLTINNNLIDLEVRDCCLHLGGNNILLC